MSLSFAAAIGRVLRAWNWDYFYCSN